MAATPRLHQILGALSKVKGPDREGWSTSLCVFHNDQNRPNLRINEYGFCCMACGAKGNLRALATKLNLEDASPSLSDRIVAEYDYRSPDGVLLFQVVRLTPKDFRQRRPDGAGGWKWDLKGITPVLYRLPELLAASVTETTFLVEGEKDVDRLRAEGLVATCNPMGAGKWRREYGDALRGRHVVLVPDNDEAGRNHTYQVASAIQSIAASVRTLELQNLPEKGDVTDWFDDGGTVEQLRSLASEAAIVSPLSAVKGLRLISAKDLIKKDLPEPRWAVPDFLPEGLSILGGKPKMGKSWLALNLGISVATGGVALGAIRTEPGDVLFLALEDTERRLQARLRDVLGDASAPASLTFSCEWPSLDEGGLDQLDLWLRTHPAARLVIVDTLAKVRPTRGRNDTLYESDYASISGLKNLADRYGVALLVIHHLRKMESTDPVDAISGTLGLAGAADAILVLKRERRQHDATIFVTGRDLDEAELSVRWSDELCCWSIVQQDEEKQRISLARKQVLDALEAQDAVSLQPSQIARLIGKGAGSVRKLLREMEMDGQVVSEHGLYRLPLLPNGSNRSNSGNDGHPGNTGNSELPRPTSVTEPSDGKVTPLKADLNLIEPESYQATAVTPHVNPQPQLPRCSGCGFGLSPQNNSSLCGRCAASATGGAA